MKLRTLALASALSLMVVSPMGGAAVATAAVDLFRSPATGNETELGYSVSAAGDVNGDGHLDFIAGAPFDDVKGEQAGRAFVWFGGPEMGDLPDVVLDEGSAFDWFGFSVAGIGDVDDDGYADVAVGAPGDDRNGEKSGSVFVYLGGPTFSGNAEPAFVGEQGGDRFGWSVSAAGDMDRDGIGDFVVGAPYAEAPGTDRGRAYLFLGDDGTSLPTTPAVVWDGPALGGPSGSTTDFQEFAPDGAAIQGPGFGWSLASLFDFRGDDRAAVAVGAPGSAGASGRVHVFFASALANSNPSTTPGIVYENATSGDRFGWDVANGGTISSDATTDLLVGAPGADGFTGEVKVFYGASSLPATDSAADLVRQRGVSGDRFGFAVSGVGEYAGNDGTWAVGAPDRDVAGVDAGWVYVYRGTSSTPDDLPPMNRAGASLPGDLWGWSLDWLGDLDADGRDDFLVGSPRANDFDGSVRGLVALVSSGLGVVSIDGDDDGADPPIRTDDLRLTIESPTDGSGPAVRFSVPRAGAWSLRVYDLRGRAIDVLASGSAAIEGTRVDFGGEDARGRALARGTYMLVLEQDGRRRSERLVWTR